MFPKSVQSSITLFNVYEVDGKIKMQRTILHGVVWSSDYHTVFARRGVATKGILFADETKFYILSETRDSNGRQYINPRQWIRLPEEEKKKYWTLRREDKVVHGIVEEDFDNPLDIEKEFGHDVTTTITRMIDRRIGSKDMRHFRVQGD